MCLQIKNKIIKASITTILKQCRSELKNNKLKDIVDKGNNVLVTCPVHKNGQENHPSCNIYAASDDRLTYGTCHCFTCGFVSNLSNFISACFDESDESFGDDWLIERFGSVLIDNSIYLPEIKLDKEKKYLDPNILKNYKYYNDYLFNRHISKTIIDKFNIGFDPKDQCVTFPVYDEHDKLVMITKRSIKDKRFYIDKDIEKPVYLLNEAIKNNDTTIYVVESQINALTLYTWNYPAVALFGTGSKYQYNILKRSGIRHYILCFDGDQAGDKGIEKFKENMPDDIFVEIKTIPRGKDVNNLSKEEFDSLVTVY